MWGGVNILGGPGGSYGRGPGLIGGLFLCCLVLCCLRLVCAGDRMPAAGCLSKTDAVMLPPLPAATSPMRSLSSRSV